MSGSVRGAMEQSIVPTRLPRFRSEVHHRQALFGVPGMGTGLEVKVLYGASW